MPKYTFKPPAPARRNRRGFTMVAVIIIGLILTAIALALATRSTNETGLVTLDRQGLQAKLLLDGATARGRARVTNLFTSANSRTNLRPLPDSVLSGVPPLMSAGAISQTLTNLNPVDGQPGNAPLAEEAYITPAGGLPYYQYAVDQDLNPSTPGVLVRYYISELPASNPTNAAQANPQNPFGLGCAATGGSPPVNNWCSTGLTGLGFVKTYRILAVLPAAGRNQPFQAQETFVAVSRQSLFNFAVLYATDLEVGPGGGMTIRGNVHTEGNAYLYSAGGSANSDPNSALVFRHLFAKDHPYYNENDSQITVIKNIYQGRKSKDSNSGSDSQNSFWVEKNNGTDLARATKDNDSISTLNGFTQGDVSIASKGDGKGSDDTWAVDSQWASKHQNEFDGRLKTGQTGATSVNIPNADQIDPQNPASSFQTTLQGDSEANPNLGGLAIETDASGNTRIKKDGSYIAYVATDGREYSIDASGNPLAERASNQRFFPEGTFIQADFFNGRESPTLSGSSYDQKKIKVTDIDITKLGQAKIRDEAGNALKDVYPSNGLIYASRADAVADSNPNDFSADSNRKPYGFRLKNGAKLPGTSLTFATNNPVYVQGDFNKHQDASGKALDPYSKDYNYAQSGDTWKTAVILSDALTVLSNNWKDSENKGTAPAVKTATDTEINAMLVTGTTESNPQTNDFSGGLQNFPRLLENWNSKTLKIRGSFVQGWLSRYGTGRWNTLGGSNGGGYYTVPKRDWGYDTNFLINPDPVVAERFPGSTTVGGAGGNRYLFSTRLNYQDYMRRACTNFYGPGSRLGWETQESCNAAGL